MHAHFVGGVMIEMVKKHLNIILPQNVHILFHGLRYVQHHRNDPVQNENSHRFLFNYQL